MIFRRDTLRRALPVLLAALIVVVALTHPARAESGASAADATQETPIAALFMNSHEISALQPGETVSYHFTPTADDIYIFRSFPTEEAYPAVSARLIRESDNTEIAAVRQEAGFLMNAGLTAGERYRLDIRYESAGSMAVEVMPDARGRCFDNPIALPVGSIRYAKTIVNARDVHWFAFTAPVTGLYSIRTEQAGDTILDTRGYLMDESGRTLGYSDDILFPGDVNFMIQAALTAGKTYFIRVSAFSNLTGAYRLVLTAPEEGQVVPEQVQLSQHELTLNADEEHTLTAQLSPAGALPELVYASSNQSVVTVEPDGTLKTRAAGEATVWVYSYNGVSDSCRVTVRPVAVTGMTLPAEEFSLYSGEQIPIAPRVEPVNATNPSVKYESSDETVFRVDADGWLTGVSEGEATLTVVSEDGGFTDTARIRVMGARPAYRALVLGEHSYQDSLRVGGENTAQGVADMLSGQSIDGSSYQVRLMMDSTREEIETGISETFYGAAESDISLLYINCHGAYEEGVAFLRLHDEDRVTVDELAEMLHPIPGTVIVILDFCQSGAFIGRGGEFEQFFEESTGALSAQTPLTQEKYIVLASAGADEDSYRRSFSSASNEASTASILGRSLCEGAGWDLIYDRSVTMKADANRDRVITMQEIHEYALHRVAYYLEGTGVTQTVYLYPEGDDTVAFGRS